MTSPLYAVGQAAMFRGLPASAHAELAAQARSRGFQRDDLIYLEGDIGEGLYVVVRGAVKLFMTSPQGKEQVFRIVRAGGTFNEIPMFDGGPNPAGAQAIEAGEALILPRSLLYEMARTYPDFGLAVASVFAERLRTLISLVEDLSFRSVTGRVAHLLLETSGAANGTAEAVTLSQQEIANMVGTAREVVGRAVRAMEADGAIRMERQHIEVLAPELLRRYV
jgi:CRP/FNR family transcriptional regulator